MALLVALLCVTAVWTDLNYRKIPNLLLGATMAAAAGLVLLGDGAALSPGGRLLGFVLGFLVMLPAYLLRAMAAGDVKFFAVLGLLLGPSALLPVWLAASVLALAHSAVVLLRRSPLWLVWLGSRASDADRNAAAAAAASRGVPYAGYLAIGALLGIASGGIAV